MILKKKCRKVLFLMNWQHLEDNYISTGKSKLDFQNFNEFYKYRSKRMKKALRKRFEVTSNLKY